MIREIKVENGIGLNRINVRPDEEGDEVFSDEYFVGTKIAFVVNGTEVAVSSYEADSIYLSATKEKFLIANAASDNEAEIDLKKPLTKKIHIKHEEVGEYVYIYIRVEFLISSK